MNESFFAVANAPTLYLLVAGVIAIVMAMAVYFLIKSYREGIRIGMEKAKLKKVVVSSATFTVVPSFGILMGVIALAGKLGVPVPWLRLSVVGALHYESMAADTAAKAMGMTEFTAANMDVSALVTITLVMSIGIIWGALFTVLFFKKYQSKLTTLVQKDLSGGEGKNGKGSNLGDVVFNAMFIGLICAFVGQGFQTVPEGNFTALGVILIAAACMGLFTLLSKHKFFKWMESFSLSFAMFIGMASAILFQQMGWLGA